MFLHVSIEQNDVGRKGAAASSRFPPHPIPLSAPSRNANPRRLSTTIAKSSQYAIIVGSWILLLL
jgi:hypothetical protein